MVDLSEIQAAYYMVAATGVLVAAVFYILNMKATLQTRQAQLYMQIYNESKSREMWEADFDLNNVEIRNNDDFRELLKDKGKWASFCQWGTYFEGMGVLVRENLLDIRLVAELISGELTWFWEKYEAGIRDVRKTWEFPRFYVEVEYLYGRVKAYGLEHPEIQVATPKPA